MKYTLSRSFVKNTKRKLIGVMIFCVSVGGLLAYRGILGLDYQVVIGGYLLWIGYRQKAQLTYWNNTNDLIFLETDKSSMTVSDPRESRVMDIESVDKVVLQKIRGKVNSIVFHANDGDIKKLQGFDDMDDIAEKIKDMFGEEKIKAASFFHH